MKLEELEKIKVKIKKEYNSQDDKISKLSQKLSIIRANNIYNKVLRVVWFSLVPWVMVTVALVVIDFKGTVVFAPMISGLSVGIPAVVGVVAEKIYMKKYKLKEKLKEVTDVSNQQQLIEAEVRCAIESEKLFHKNKSLKSVYDKVVEEKNLLETVLYKYDVVEKNSEVDSKISLGQNIENINFELEQKEKKLDLFVTKKVLKDFFSQLKSMERTTDFMLSFAFFVVLNVPIIITHQITYQVSGALLNLVLSFLISGTAAFLFTLKKNQDKTKSFEILNNECGEYGLSEKEMADKFYGYEKEINQLLEEISTLRLDLEQSKVKLESRAMLENADEKDKKENYSYKFNDRQLNDDSLSQQKDVEKSVHLTRKKVKEDDGCYK